ncbi:type II secretion system minor pseudopilin GspI [Pseudooceanicola sp. MF1-13]|uniref:type II secretion system minor pseudopilin GspI n=1 Tax=Pseudooceanicola sp. MF1-13 TaxID=3379095 RepID=UPI003892A582
MTARHQNPEAGFTLIETLVAMAVLAVAGVTLLTASERHAAQTGKLVDRIGARWVAENGLAAATLNIGMQPEWQRQLGQDWQVSELRQSVPNSGLDQVTVLVARAGGDPEDTTVRLVGYLPATTEGTQ